MANIRVVAKETGQVVAQSGNEVRLLKPSVVTVDITPSQIQSIARDGNRIVIRLKSGETVTIENFFGPNGEATSDLVIHDNDSNGFWAVGYSDATGEFALSPIESADQLLAAQAAGDSLVPLIAFAAAGVGMGVAAGLASSGGNSSGRSPAKDNAQTGSHFDVTSNNMYGLVGTADPGTSITLTRPDGSTVTTVASDSGVWHFNPNPLSDGEQGTVTGIDPNGRPVGPLGTGVADVTPPAEPAIEHNGAGELSGSAEPGSTITLTLPDGSTVTTVTDGNGHWSFGPNPLAEGDEGTLTATDPAGNHSAPETTGPADRTPPDESQLSVDHNNQDGLSGTGTPGDTIILTLPDGTTVTTIVDENGHWEFVPNPLPEGGTGTITEVDPNGNTTGGITTGPSDQTPPDETQLSVDENNGHGLGGTGTPGDTITVERPDGTTVTTIVDENGHWEFVPNPLPDGGTGTVTETDPAGNSTGGITTGPSDQTPPDDTQLSVDENNGHGLGGTGTPGDTITVERPDGTTVTTIVDENGHWEFVPNPLPDGGTGTVTETDPAGNSTGGVTTGPSDQTPPDESQLSVDENNGHGLGGTGTPGDTITVERPDGTTVTTTVDENGHWEITPNPLPDGGTGTVTETDPAGNSTGGITTGPSDQTPPDESQLTVDENNGHGLGGTGTPGDTITVERPDGTTVTTTVDENGHWEITPNPLPDGGTGTVTETDPAGNSTGGITTGPSDQTAPPAPNVEQNNGNGLGGTGEPGDTITVERPDGSTVTTTVDDNGHWEIAPNPLPDGGSGTVTETDPAGNVSDGTTTGPSDLVPPVSTDLGSVNLVDDVGPVTGTIARGGSTDDPKPTFSGHASGDVATVNVYDNGTLIGSAAVDASGNWSFEPAEPLADGAHDFQAAPVDAAGNVGPKTADWSFTVVTDAASAPAAPAITLVTDDAGPVTGPLQKGDTTDDRTPTISGTGTAGTTVTIFVNGTAVGSQVVDDDGNWSVTVPALTGDGQKTITAQASDGAGRQSPMTGGYPIVLDTTAPTAPGVVTATDDVGSVKGPIAAGGVTDDTQPGFSGSGAEPGATVTVYDGSTVLGTTTVDASGNWAFTPAGVLANGSHAISVTLTDHAGNTSAASPALNFTINPDTTVVSIVKAVDDVGPIQGDVANNGLTDDPTPTLVGTATAGAVVTVSEGATVLGSVTADASGNWSLTLPAQTEGAHTYTATSNGAGSGSTASFTLNLDLSAPAAPGIGSVTVTDDVGVYQGSVPQNGSIDDTTPTLAGSGATPGDTINVYDNGTLVGSATVGPDGNWNYTPTTPLAEGQHNLTVSQVDPAGNESAQSAPFAVVVDTTPPGPLDGSSLTLTDDVGTITGPIARGSATDDARPTFGGRAPAGDVATVNVYDNGALIGSAAVDASGNWSFEPDLPLEAGSHSFQAAPVDAAGNEGPLTPAWSFTMAGPAPAAPAITLVTDDAGPVTGPLQKGDTTDDRTPTISGTGTVGTTVTVFVDGTAVGSATVDNDGNWSVTTPALTGDGQKTITAQASDVAGQLSPMTGGYPIVLDTTAPTAPGVVTATDDVGSVKGPIAAGGVTDDTQPDFSGSGAEPGATVTVYDGGKALGTTTVDQNGNWSFTPVDPLASGSHAVSVTLTDHAGNTSGASPALNFTVDPDPTVVSIVKATDNVGNLQGDVANNGLTDDPTPTLVGTATAGAVVTVKEGTTVLGSVTADASGNWSLTLPAQTEGAHTYTATASNGAGAQSDASFTLNLDLTVPAVPDLGAVTVGDDVGLYQGDLAQNGYTDDTTPTLAGSGATPGDTIKVYDNGTPIGSATVAPDGTWSYTPTTPLAEGAHNLSVSEVDPAGNESAKSPPFAINVDTTAPVALVAITAINPDTGTPGDFITSATNLSVSGTLSQALGANESVQVSTDGGATWVNATSVAGTSWTYVDPRALPDGDQTYQVRVIDAAGNVGSTASQVVIVDTGISMDVQITGITPDSGVVGDFITNAGQITVSGTLSRPLPGGGKVQVSTDGGNTWADVATTDTNWIYADPAQHTSSTVHYDVRVLGPSGDVVSTTGQDIVFDMTPPAALAQIVSVTQDLGASSSDFITSDNRPVINGQVNQPVDDGSSVLVSIDGGNSWQPATTFDGTNWTLDLTGQTLADGSYVLQARVQDAAGNLGTISTQQLQIDTQPVDAGGITSTLALNGDTSVGVSGAFSTAQTATNADLVTRDESLTFSGTLNKALATNQYLQLSLDGGENWITVLSHSGVLWTYSADPLTASQTLDVRLQVVSASGVVATGTNFDHYSVVVDLDAPDKIALAPTLAAITDTGAAYAFSSSLYNKVAAGSLVALVDDVNRDGTYEEGIDRITGYASADQNGDWSFNASLGKGLHSVGFMVWDAAGNASGFGPLVMTSTGTLTNTVGSSTSSTGWGGTATGGDWGLGAGAATIDENGNWAFFQSSIGTKSGAAAYSGWVFDVTPNGYSATYLPESSAVANAPTNGDDYGHVIRQGVFVDVNRDGYMDVLGKVSQDSAAVALWTKNADGSYTASSFTFPTPAWWNPLDQQNTFGAAGSVIAWDRYGDGYSDFVVTYSGAGLSWQSDQSYTYISNNNGVLSADAGQNGFRWFQTEVSGVDVNNNGTVDLAGRSDQDSGRALDIQLFNADGSIGADKMYNGVFRGDGAYFNANTAYSMTWADFNGDGYLDLYLNRGYQSPTTTGNSDESRIYLNQGNDANGNWLGMSANPLYFDDTLAGTASNHFDGGASLAVDWNHDGKMDVIEVPRQNIANYPINAPTAPMVYLNSGTNVWTGTGKALGTTLYDDITGAVAVDYDWDGAVDLVMYRAGSTTAGVNSNTAPAVLIHNDNAVAYGTSLTFKILDQNGVNSFFGNTVKLYNSAGDLVATQVINAQSSVTTDSSGLLHFYGLDPHDTYSVQLLRNDNGSINHVGGSAYNQSYANGTVNSFWNVYPGDATNVYVLTAEATNAVNDTTAAGIVGTGYNDAFYGTLGDDVINGGGGWNTLMDGSRVWSETQGGDLIDYSNATGMMNVNLMTGVATGMGNDTLIGIETVIGGNYGNSITDNAANNTLRGGAGNDVFYLTNGGNDTVQFNVLKNADATGGNGHDTVYGFTVGDTLTNANADVLKLSGLLSGYGGTTSLRTDGGEVKLDAASQGLQDYLKVEVVGNDTVVSVDRDGAGGQYTSTAVVTLVNVQTDLLTLLQNHQLVI